MALEGGRQGAGPQLSGQGPGIGRELCGRSQAAAPSRAVVRVSWLPARREGPGHVLGAHVWFPCPWAVPAG